MSDDRKAYFNGYAERLKLPELVSRDGRISPAFLEAWTSVNPEGQLLVENIQWARNKIDHLMRFGRTATIVGGCCLVLAIAWTLVADNATWVPDFWFYTVLTIFLLGVATAFYIAKKNQLPDLARTYFWHSERFLDSMNAFREVAERIKWPYADDEWIRITSKTELRMQARGILVLYAKRVHETQDEIKRLDDRSGELLEVQAMSNTTLKDALRQKTDCLAEFSRAFNTMKGFGLTEPGYQLYFNEARKILDTTKKTRS